MDGLFLISRRRWWELVNNTVIESHLSVTSGSSRERTWTTHLIDRDSNDCAISPPPFRRYKMNLNEIDILIRERSHVPVAFMGMFQTLSKTSSNSAGSSL